MEKHRQWWNSLDAYWKRFFKIELKPHLDANREERDRYTPDDDELQTLFERHHLRVSNVSINTLRPLSELNLTSLLLDRLPSLKSFDGIENLKLEELEMSGVQVADFSPVGKLRNLRLLQLRHNQLASSGFLNSLLQLRHLVIDEPVLKEMDGLAGLVALEILVCGNLKADLSPIRDLRGLVSLHIVNCELPSLLTIGPLPRLTTLELSGINASSLRGVEQFPALKSLLLCNCTTNDLGLVSQLTNLESLDLSKTQVRDLTVLAGLSSLREIFIPEDNFTKEAILAFKAQYPTCKVYSERGRNFPFMKYKEYQVIAEKGELQLGTSVKFTGYTYNHYDGIGIYYFLQAVPYHNITIRIGDYEDFNWSNCLVEI